MRRILFAAFAAGLVVTGVLALGAGSYSPVKAAITFNAHVHDDYFHPTGSFVPGPGHVTAQALCMQANPDPTCTAAIEVGDSIQWVAPAPLAANPHSVTECTDNTFTVCGAGVAAPNPIEDSGVRFQPGWPYLVAFNTAGTYYYRCEIHPVTMRGRVQVNAAPIGGGVDLAVSPESGGGLSKLAIAAAAAVGMIAVGGLGLAARRRLSPRTAEPPDLD